MRLVSLSLDAHLLETGSVVAQRHIHYAETLDTLTVVVPAQTDCQVALAPNATVYGVGGSKFRQFFKLYRVTAAVMRTNGADVITAQDIYFLGLLGYLLARRFACGLEVQIHGLEKLHGFRAHLARFVLRRASSVRAVSARAVAQVEAALSLSLGNVTIVPVYVDVAAFNTAAESNLVPSNETITSFRQQYANRFNVLTVARLVPVKNIALQLQALEEIVKEQPHVCLHIVGDGPLRETLAAEVLERGLASHVVFHGYQTGLNLQALFALADCFVLTSNSEGWGMVVVEAAYVKLPIIMTDVGCAGTVIRHEEQGLVIHPGDANGLVTALNRLITDREFAASLAAAAAAAVRALPSLEDTVALYHTSWQRAAAKPVR